MGEITAIKFQKKNDSRCSVYIDGEFALGLDGVTVIQNGLKVGGEITEEELETLALESEKQSAFDKALKYVSKFRKTEKELFFYLTDKGYAKSTKTYVLNKLKSYGYLNDEAYARDYLSDNIKSKGLYRIKYDLKGKGVSDEVIASLKVEENAEKEAIAALAEKYLKNKELTRENLSKAAKYLSNRGYSYEDVASVLKADEFYD